MKKILAVRHIVLEGPGTLGEFLTEKKRDFALVDAFENDGEALRDIDLDRTAAVVILGGPMNVYEEAKHPFLRQEKYFIRELVLRKIPLMGVCLGAQLIAVSLGARVRRAAKKEVGWFNIRLTKDAGEDVLLKGLAQDLEVFQWHEDTFELPQNATELARGNGLCQAFRFHRSAWAFQFHIEVDKDMIASWCREYIGEAGPQDSCAGMLGRYDQIEADFRRQARQIFGAFLEQAIP